MLTPQMWFLFPVMKSQVSSIFLFIFFIYIYLFLHVFFYLQTVLYDHWVNVWRASIVSWRRYTLLDKQFRVNNIYCSGGLPDIIDFVPYANLLRWSLFSMLFTDMVPTCNVPLLVWSLYLIFQFRYEFGSYIHVSLYGRATRTVTKH